MNNNPYFNQYQQDLLNMRERIDRQLQQAQPQQMQHQVPITQNFQLAPTQSGNGIKYVNSIDDVKKELVFVDTLFVNKEYTTLWYKNASGEVKTYELKEIIEMDEKDRKIADLTSKIDMLERELKREMMNNATTSNVDANVNATIADTKPTGISNDKPSKK